MASLADRIIERAESEGYNGEADATEPAFRAATDVCEREGLLDLGDDGPVITELGDNVAGMLFLALPTARQALFVRLMMARSIQEFIDGN